ncbi:MAG: radical SAM protein [Promethearchaeota archaeon]
MNVNQLRFNEEIASKMQHYIAILEKKKMPNYKIARSLPVKTSFKDLGQDNNALRAIHQSVHEKFMALLASPVEGDKLDASTGDGNYLELKLKILNNMLKSCMFCELRCGAKRSDGEVGRCGVGMDAHASSWFLHHGEELPLVPSGTIFFSGCNFKCVFCQNHDISTQPDAGAQISPRRLAQIASSLEKEGARNINYVGGDPIPNLHVIVESLLNQAVNVALLWNSNLYMTLESLSILIDVIDIWLPDFKYGNNACGKRYSKVDNYWDVVTRNLKYIHDEMVNNDNATLIIRHLVMPGHVECCSIPILNWISKNLPNSTVNIMAQYRPQHLVLKQKSEYKEINRLPTPEEMSRVKAHADAIGISWRSVS